MSVQEVDLPPWRNLLGQDHQKRKTFGEKMARRQTLHDNENALRFTVQPQDIEDTRYGPESLSFFSLGSYIFGFALKDIEGIRPRAEVVKIPLAPDWVEGLANDRGRVVVAVDLRRRLGIEEDRVVESVKPMGIAVLYQGSLYVCAIDKPWSIFSPQPRYEVEIPVNLKPSCRPYIRKAYLWRKKIILELDVLKLLSP